MPGKENSSVPTAKNCKNEPDICFLLTPIEGLMTKLWMQLARFTKSLLPGTSAERSRLEGDILAFERHLDYLVFEKKLGSLIKENTGSGSWVDSADKSLEAARKALEDYDFNLGWRCLHKAQSTSLRGLGAEGRKVEAQIILNEARDKLGNSWRKKSIEDLLTKQGELKADISSEELVKADEILIGYLENRYHKIGAFTRHLSLLSFFAAMAIIAFLILLAYPLGNIDLGVLTLNNRSTGNGGTGLGIFTWNLSLSIVIFGVMGAIVSGMLSARARADARIPDQRISNILTLAKLAVGAMSALAVVAFITSGILSIPEKTTATPELILAVSFAAGFTERLVYRAVDTVAKSDSKK